MNDMSTEQEAMAQIAEESPEAANLAAMLMLHSAREREAMLPTWEQLQEAEQKAYERGFEDGQAAENYRLKERVFG